MKPIAQIAVIIVTIPVGIFLAMKVTGLDKLQKMGMAAGRKYLGEPLQGGARSLSGRVANWGAQRGLLGRTAARVFTGSLYPGGRRQLERIGESWRKADSERRQARGSYRLQPSDKMNAEALERVSPDAIKRWVNSDNPGTRKAVAALRSMVEDTPAIKLSTAQREALFSGGADVPDTTLPKPNPASPTRTRPQTSSTGLFPDELPVVDSAREGGLLEVGTWWSSRPSIVPGPRMRGQSIGSWLTGHYVSGGNPRNWRSWAGRTTSSSNRGAADPRSPGRPDPLSTPSTPLPPLPPPPQRPARPGF